jgi:hypothetical protein
LTQISSTAGFFPKTSEMLGSLRHHTPQREYLALATVAIICAAVFAVQYPTADLPGVGRLPLMKLTLLAAFAGYPLLWFLRRLEIVPAGTLDIGSAQIWRLLALGAVLALPPIAIDLVTGFPRNMNVPIPEAFVFYPAVALLAEVQFHLLPLAVLIWFLRDRAPLPWLFAPVVFAEPVFQAMYATGPAVQSALVFASVSLVSAAQLWLFRHHGFGAMIALRLVFYFFWHIAWGTARLWVPV